jgi:predicted metal-dependent phosphoesterase TrpH
MPDGLLLCELHAHTTWSDGFLTLPELVDLYGRAGFDVLCITDHTVRIDDPTPRAVDPWMWPAHAAAVAAEAERARTEYGLIVIQGLELSDNHDDPDQSAHVLALGLEGHISVDNGLVRALEAVHAQGAALVAAHPYSAADVTPLRAARRIWREREALGELIHRYELFNRREVFAWVAAEELPPVATGDVHRAEHLSSWKTLLPCERDAEAVVTHLRSRGRVLLTPYAAGQRIRLPLAA